MDFDVMHPICLDDEVLAKHSNALRTAGVLASGLAHIYRCVSNAETQTRSQLAEKTQSGIGVFRFGNMSDLSEIPAGLIECMFRWYSVTACDFVRIASWIAEFDGQVRKDYVETVLGPVRAYRDKVGAHTSGVTANKRDNDAERLISTVGQICWMNNRYKTGVFSVRIARGENLCNSDSVQPWSLTDFHLQLCDRYPILAQT